MCQGAIGFYECIPGLPQHVSAKGCHLHGFVGAVEATQVVSVLWAYMDYNLSSVASCREPPEDGNRLLKRVGVNLEYVNKIHWPLDAICWSFATKIWGSCLLQTDG
jgi:hypothetical protein